jgi:outer membrane protein
VRAIPTTIQTIQAGKNEPSMSSTGSQPAPASAATATQPTVPRIPRSLTTSGAEGKARGPAPRRAVGLVAAVALAAGCGPYGRTALTHPETLAPPAAGAAWQPPAGLPPRVAAQPLPGTDVAPEPDREYDLAELVSLALRESPETRRAWEEARAEAARLGQAEGAYAPTVAAGASGGYEKIIYATPTGTEVVRSALLEPQLALQWVLFDFGRRGADREAAWQRLLAANFAFNRRLQEVVFAVQRGLYALDASRAGVTAARATLESARAVEQATEERLRLGLATRPDLLLARQERVRAEFDVEDARGRVADAHAALAEAVGVSPTLPLRVVDLSAEPLPPALGDTVERVIDGALADRPDLAARLATLRASEAEVRRARADYLPRLALRGNVGGSFQRYRAGPPYATFTADEPLYGAFLGVEWTIFDGLVRENRVREAEARRGAAAADLRALELRTLREVWKAYADVKTAARKYDFAEALLAASDDAWRSTLASYREGLGSVLDVLAAERELARARTTLVASRADLLTAAASLAYAAGEGGAR